MRPTLNNVRPSWERRLKRPSTMVLVLFALFASVLSVNATTASAATPTCQSASSDSDGDGWGFENNRSCRVPTKTPPRTQPSAADAPICKRVSSDPDRDTFGWENNQQCRLLQEVTDIRIKDVGSPAWLLEFTDEHNDGKVQGWKIYRDGVFWRNVTSSPNGNTKHIIWDSNPGDTILYGIEPIVAGGGLDYTARIDVYVPLDFTTPSTPLRKEERYLAPASTGIGKAQRITDASFNVVTDAYEEKVRAQNVWDGWAQEAGRVTNNSGQNQSDTITREIGGSGQLGTEGNSVTVTGEAGTANTSGNSNGRIENFPNPYIEDQFKNATRELNEAKERVTRTTIRYEAAVIQEELCNSGNCAYPDDPTPRTPPPDSDPCPDCGKGNTTDDPAPTSPFDDPPPTHPGCYGSDDCKQGAAPTHDNRGRPYCLSASSDSDNDGWGWENNRSCVVR